jgi:thioesterase domain-containing protein
VHLVHYPRPEPARPGHLAVADLAEACLPALRPLAEAGGPLVLLGYSYGGRVAHEAAARLQAEGHPASLLVIGDIGPGSTPLAGGRGRLLDGLVRRDRLLPVTLLLACRTLFLRLGRGGWGGRLDLMIVRRRIHAWRPRPYAGRTCLLLSEELAAARPGATGGLGWEASCPDLAVLPVAGRHLDFFLPPHDGALVRGLLEALRWPATC